MGVREREVDGIGWGDWWICGREGDGLIGWVRCWWMNGWVIGLGERLKG